MFVKRIVPCLDIKDGRVVKGVNFVNFADAGEPLELAKKYASEGADEIVFLDISATVEGRNNTLSMIEEASREIAIPITVGGGISSVSEVDRLLRAGATRVSVNTSVVKNKEFLAELYEEFGSGVIVVAIDVKRNADGMYEVMINGGNEGTGINALDWAKEAEGLGAGELLVTSIDTDGMQKGYDLELITAISKAVSIPTIASGGAGRLVDFKDAILAGADAVLAASLFHFDIVSVADLKMYLMSEGIPMRYKSSTRG